MNEEQMNAPVPNPGAATANEEGVVSSVLNNIRQIFGRSAEPTETPADASNARVIIIRNCSTKHVLALLTEKLGGAESASGRYFIPKCQDIAKIRAVATAADLFVKVSTVADIAVLDLMVDRTKRPFPGRGEEF